MYNCFLTNMGYTLPETHYTVATAFEYGKSKGFEFYIYKRNSGPIVSWSPIGGTRWSTVAYQKSLA